MTGHQHQGKHKDLVRSKATCLKKPSWERQKVKIRKNIEKGIKIQNEKPRPRWRVIKFIIGFLLIHSFGMDCLKKKLQNGNNNSYNL